MSSETLSMSVVNHRTFKRKDWRPHHVKTAPPILISGAYSTSLAISGRAEESGSLTGKLANGLLAISVFTNPATVSAVDEMLFIREHPQLPPAATIQLPISDPSVRAYLKPIMDFQDFLQNQAVLPPSLSLSLTGDDDKGSNSQSRVLQSGGGRSPRTPPRSPPNRGNQQTVTQGCAHAENPFAYEYVQVGKKGTFEDAQCDRKLTISQMGNGHTAIDNEKGVEIYFGRLSGNRIWMTVYAKDYNGKSVNTPTEAYVIPNENIRREGNTIHVKDNRTGLTYKLTIAASGAIMDAEVETLNRSKDSENTPVPSAVHQETLGNDQVINQLRDNKFKAGTTININGASYLKTNIETGSADASNKPNVTLSCVAKDGKMFIVSIVGNEKPLIVEFTKEQLEKEAEISIGGYRAIMQKGKILLKNLAPENDNSQIGSTANGGNAPILSLPDTGDIWQEFSKMSNVDKAKIIIGALIGVAAGTVVVIGGLKYLLRFLPGTYDGNAESIGVSTGGIGNCTATFRAQHRAKGQMGALPPGAKYNLPGIDADGKIGLIRGSDAQISWTNLKIGCVWGLLLGGSGVIAAIYFIN